LTQIKICGITNLEDARCAAQAGADFLGFILYRRSPRYIAPERIVAIFRALREEYGPRPRGVGVFVDEPIADLRHTLDVTGLDLAQLHGDEPAEEVRSLGTCAFKAIRPRALGDARAALQRYRYAFSSDETLPQLLADAYHPQQYGGTGLRADSMVARWLARRVRLLLAGGLTPENVAQTIEEVRPWGVDVSSGVEAAKGVKDHERVRAFVAAVRAADKTLPGLPDHSSD
jgi:phosphoribosylanthranilate isomerase